MINIGLNKAGAARGSSLAAFLLVGAIMIAGGFWLRSSTGAYRDGSMVDGRIVEIIRSPNNDGDAMYQPVVEYMVDDQTYRTKTYYSSTSRPQLGATRQVSYRPEDPSDGRVVGTDWLPWFFIGFGALFMFSAARGFTTDSSTNGPNLHEIPDSSGSEPSEATLSMSDTRSDQTGEMLERLHTQHGLAIALSSKATAGPATTIGNPDAKWYPDPGAPNSGRLRWWDGSSWTDDYHSGS